MAKLLNKNAYEILLREVITEKAEELAGKKVQIPYPLSSRWTTGWLKTEKDGVDICFVLDKPTAVLPYMILKTAGLYVVNRFSPIADWKTLSENEARVFKFFKNPVYCYSLTVPETITKQQQKELVKILQEEHKKLFNISIKQLNIDTIDVLEEKSDFDLEFIAEDLNKPNKK